MRGAYPKMNTRRKYNSKRPLGVTNPILKASIKRRTDELKRDYNYKMSKFHFNNSLNGNGLEAGEFGHFITQTNKKIPVLIKVQTVGNTMGEIIMKGFNGRIVYHRGTSKNKVNRILKKAKSKTGYKPM